MQDLSQAILGSWSIAPGIAFALLLLAIVYTRGWRVLTRTTPGHFPGWRLFAFLGGLLSFWVAVASPLDALASLLLSAHMVQHLLFLAVSPALILLGSPLLPLLRGLPRPFAHDGLGPFLRWPALQKIGRGLTHPATGWFAMAASLCVWHIPAAYELALRSPGWHRAEHLVFFGTALLFWWPVVQPYPSRPRWPLWFAPLYLFLADLLNTALSAILTFSEHVLYSTYADAPRLFGTTALGDQATAGLIMWVPGSLFFLVPAVCLSVRFLSPAGLVARSRAAGSSAVRVPRPAPSPVVAPRARFDLLAVPLVGRFLRTSSGRTFLQVTLLLLSIVVVADGLMGPQIAPLNLAGVLPWTYWRAFTVVALLAAGNLFCMACPFTLPRAAARRLGFDSRIWPRVLRSKWLAVALLLLFFWSYEVFGLWNHPAWTAWVILGYFGAAFLIDALFRGASFCKYICPIGQFHFVNSLVSPLEVKVLAADVCAKCKTHECLHGSASHRGCQTDLYLPSKVGNMDCTFCLDCVRACPHKNIGVLAAPPGADLLDDRPRSAVGQLSRRLDIVALGAIVVFAAFANAALMVTPVVGWRDQIVGRLGLSSALPVTTLFFLVSIILAPAFAIGGSVLAGRALARLVVPRRQIIARFALALMPLGLAMWAAHFSFHLAIGWSALGAAAQRAAAAVGMNWSNLLVSPGGGIVYAQQLLIGQTLLLDAGLLLTLYLGWRLAREYAPRPVMSLRLLGPWAAFVIALYSTGVWILLQPMQMRGA